MRAVFQDYDDAKKFLLLMRQNGINVDSNDYDDTIISALLDTMVEFEKWKIGRRLAAGRAAKRAREGFCGGSDPYGYRRRGDELQPDEREQSILRLAAELWPENSLRQICKRLSYLGFNNRNGSPFHPQTIARILART